MHEAAGREDSFTLTAMTSSLGAAQSETSCRGIFAVKSSGSSGAGGRKERKREREEDRKTDRSLVKAFNMLTGQFKENSK